MSYNILRSRALRWILATLGVLALLALLAVAGLHLAARTLKDNVIQALGNESEVADLTVSFTSIVITGVRIKAPRGWPTDSTLKAARVVIVPDVRQLLSRHIYITSVKIQDGYISAVRPKEGGGLKILPSMLGASHKAKAERTGRTGEVQTVELDNCVVELYDATVTGHQKLRVDAVHGTIKDLKMPELDSRAKVDLNGVIKGGTHQGTIAVTGWVEVANKASELTTRVRNVDLALFEPYLFQKTKAGIDQGTFNLDMKSSIRNNQVNAPGTLVLTGLKLKSGEGALSGLSNIPRRAFLSSLADNNDTITLDFDIKGNLDNPGFSLSQGLGFRTAIALLKGVGLGFEGLVRAFFALVSGFGSAFSGAS